MQSILHPVAARDTSNTTTRQPLPPFGKQWLRNPPSAGLVVAIGPDAWDRGQARSYVCLVLPEDRDPAQFRWPTNHKAALILESGPGDDVLLHHTAIELLRVGAPVVVALRECQMHDDPRVFFELGDGDDA